MAFEGGATRPRRQMADRLKDARALVRKTLGARVRETLENVGYRVLEARDGPEALEKAKESLAQITLVLTDLVMPKMSGLELVHALRADHPQLPVHIISGHAPDTEIDERALDPELDYIDQPLSAERILQRVRESLEHA